MSRSSLLLLLIVLVIIGVAVALGSVNTEVAPRTVEKDMLNAAAAQ